jgi:glyoxylase-like metal-dependent hydrolase (beta-lactamase superfamily II)/rhodanese-related sulfurtransferase
VIFLQNQDPDTATFTYLLADPATREAALIDPVLEHVDRDMALLERLGLTLRYTIETHVHADHVSGGGRLRQLLGSETVMHASGGAACADRLVNDGDVVEVGGLRIEVRYTPGHTSGCTSYRLGDRVFTGDTLLIGGCGRTDFQQGDAGTLYDSIHRQLFSLPDETLMFPGHDYNGHICSTIGWEKANNRRLGGGRSRDGFIEIMDNLDLAQPKRIDEAVPANLRCGLPEDPGEPLEALGIDRGGYRDLSPARAKDWVERVLAVDVREAHERTGPLGHIAGTKLVPLGVVTAVASEWDRTQPVLLICRSGGRSGRAAAALAAAGFESVYNLAGGMIAWNEAGLPVVGAGAGA